MPRTRVATLIDGLEIGGAELLVANMLECADRDRYEHAVFPLQGDGEVAERIRSFGVSVFSPNAPVTSAGGFAGLRRAIAGFAPEVLHTHLRLSDVLGGVLVLGARPRVPVVTTLHNVPEAYERASGLRGRAIRSLFRRTVRGASHRTFVAISQPVLDAFRSSLAPSAATLVVENGVALGRMRPPTDEERAAARRGLGLGDDAFVVVCLAQFRPQKGHLDLLHGFAEGLKDINGATLLLAGDGEERSAIERAVDALGLRGRVRFLGVLADPTEALRAADVFALASHYEGFGLVVIEAQAHGLPSVVTAVDALPGLVRDGRDGLLAPKGAPEVFGRALRRLATEPETRRRMTETVRAKDLSRWSVETTMRRYEEVYSSLVRSKG